MSLFMHILQPNLLPSDDATQMEKKSDKIQYQYYTLNTRLSHMPSTHSSFSGTQTHSRPSPTKHNLLPD